VNPSLPKLKKLYSDSQIPKRGSEYAAGYDLYAYTDNKLDIVIYPGECKLVGTGVAIQPPNGYCAFIMARSGLATKQGLRLANGVGLCDYDYTGEYKVAVYNDSACIRKVHHGDRIAQLVFMPFYYNSVEKDNDFIIVNELEETERADGGFGHTGV
jgi:dUTP pyrophosphatase